MKQREHVRHYESGKRTMVNNGLKKRRRRLQTVQVMAQPEPKAIVALRPKEQEAIMDQAPMSDYAFPLKRGWLVKYLIAVDYMTNKRWTYWGTAMVTGKIPEQIPQIKWLGMPEPSVLKMLEKAVQVRMTHGESRYRAIEQLFDWLLWGFGDLDTKKAPDIDEKTNLEWYKTINLGPLLEHPHDYAARLLEIFGVEGGPGWFATPMNVTIMMNQIMGGDKGKPWDTWSDPAVGTGSMLLPASNYSLSLHGQDVSHTVLHGLRLNGWLYVPWLIKPFPKRMLDDLQMRMTGKLDKPAANVAGIKQGNSLTEVQTV